MHAQDMDRFYRAYLDCLNRRDWDALGEFVAESVSHNGRAFGLEGYRRMLEDDVRAIPDLRFSIDQLACTAPIIAARLVFDCTPMRELFGLPVNGRRVRFCEHVFYRVEAGRIAQVWSLIDRAAIQAQLSQVPSSP